MAYSDFTLESACLTCGLEPDEGQDLFAPLPSVQVSSVLRAVLDEFVPLATSIHTEKARSEFIVAPVLGEVRKLLKHRISLFSGIDFNVDPARGLNGTCDFILAASPIQLFLRNPILTIVEAKNDNIKSCLGQCVAEMVGARVFNEREQRGSCEIHGAVTTGSNWRFLRLDRQAVLIDRSEYYIEQVEKILAILLHCVGGDPATAGAAA
jgi:hypothetical protein